MAKLNFTTPLSVAADDPLAAEHAAVAAWIEDGFRKIGTNHYYGDIDMKDVPSGAALLAGNPEQSRRYVLAAVAHIRHWDDAARRVRNQAENEMQRINAHMLPDWPLVWGRRRLAEAVMRALMRRKLPFQRDDLAAILSWCNTLENISTYQVAVGSIVKALKRFADENPVDDELRVLMRSFATLLRSAYDKDCQRFGTEVEQLARGGGPEPIPEPEGSWDPPPQSAPAGSPLVLTELKQRLGMLPADSEREFHRIEPDHFPLSADSPLRSEHAFLSEAFAEVVGTRDYYHPNLKKHKFGRKLMQLTPTDMGRMLMAAAERHVNTLLPSRIDLDASQIWQSRYTASSIATSLLEFDFQVDREGAFDLLLFLSILSAHQHLNAAKMSAELIEVISAQAARSPLTEGERFVLSLWRASQVSGPMLGAPSEDIQRLTNLINDGVSFYLAPGEVWADAVNEELTQTDPATRAKWCDLLRHALTATSARPSAKWNKQASELIATLGEKAVTETLLRWFPLVSEGRAIRKFGFYPGDQRGSSDTMHDENSNALRGLLWCIPLMPRRDDLIRAVTSVALTAYKKVPGVGPRAVKVGNAAIYTLSELGSEEAVGQLAILKVRVKFGTAQKQIEKAFDAAANALGLPREEIEELGVPSYGLEEVGVRREDVGDYRAELRVTGSDAELLWFDANGKALKSVPAKVKSDFKEDFADLKQSLKDVQAMLPAQRDRIDGLFLAQKSWVIDLWRDRYLNHPLVGTIARRLLWCVDGTPALFSDGSPVDIEGKPIVHGKTAEITLWHPVGRTIDEITGWRRKLEELGITQPFKQAHRELYLLTDAERNTNTYSNRFAGHVLRQHQFNALCAARGWKNKLRLMVDDTYPPATKDLPQWGFRAEYWVEGIGDAYGTDTNESGVYLRLSTDQVRFYRTGAAPNTAHAGGGGYGTRAAGPGVADINEPVALDLVPELVFSEIMRDVDLFVGVSSVGNDPNWQDGGPEGRYVDYWHSYSFGELSGTATTRKQVLERLIPRLKIAARCSFSDRFLVVRGELRTYKIHLGSGNILMEPNDQYLCIVASRKLSNDDLYLPFEGDATLSVIISKALMLADDTKIKDLTITSQIKGK